MSEKINYWESPDLPLEAIVSQIFRFVWSKLRGAL